MTAVQEIQLPCPAGRLVKHRPPMLLIDDLLLREGDRAAASATIADDCPCLSPHRGLLPEYFIEIIAQTMAAANGYDALCRAEDPADGFIVGIDRFTFSSPPAEAKTFHIEIAKTMEFGAMKVMEGRVLADAVEIAVVELKVWEQPQ